MRAVRPQLSTKSWRKTRAYIRRLDGDRCRVCGSDGWIPEHRTRSGQLVPGRHRLVVGHIVPAERYPGHHDDPANLRTMCVACNNSQRDLDDKQWAEARAARGQATRTTLASPSPFGRRSAYGRPRIW